MSIQSRLRTCAVVSVILASCSACSSSNGSSEPPASAEQPAEPAEPQPEALPEDVDETGSRPQLTAEQCQANGGTVVGDIGDGAIHRPDYTCPDGSAPSGSIAPAAGEPIAVEGAVCCP